MTSLVCDFSRLRHDHQPLQKSVDNFIVAMIHQYILQVLLHLYLNVRLQVVTVVQTDWRGDVTMMTSGWRRSTVSCSGLCSWRVGFNFYVILCQVRFTVRSQHCQIYHCILCALKFTRNWASYLTMLLPQCSTHLYVQRSSWRVTFSICSAMTVICEHNSFFMSCNTMSKLYTT